METLDLFTILFSIVVLLGMLSVILKLLPRQYDTVKKTLFLAMNVLMPSALYFGALHLRPNMSTAWFVGYTAVYLGFIFFRSWQAVKVSR